jgi:hypothetical protein
MTTLVFLSKDSECSQIQWVTLQLPWILSLTLTSLERFYSLKQLQQLLLAVNSQLSIVQTGLLLVPMAGCNGVGQQMMPIISVITSTIQEHRALTLMFTRCQQNKPKIHQLWLFLLLRHLTHQLDGIILTQSRVRLPWRTSAPSQTQTDLLPMTVMVIRSKISRLQTQTLDLLSYSRTIMVTSLIGVRPMREAEIET